MRATNWQFFDNQLVNDANQLIPDIKKYFLNIS